MDETQKPFACKAEGCTMSFTNLDHLNVHTKKHAMSLQLSLGNKAAFVADQTPTPTRLIRNCDEVGLFEDLHLQHVNPFEETFRQAVESKHGTSITPTLDHAMIVDDTLPQDETTLHTPNVLPYYDLSNCTFKEESITLGDEVIASRSNSDNELEDCTFDPSGTINTKIELIEDVDSEPHFSEDNAPNEVENSKTDDIIVFHMNKPRPPGLILSKQPSSLSSKFKKIVDETLNEETNSPPTQPAIQPTIQPAMQPVAQPIVRNTKTIVIKPLPKLTRILPMVPVQATERKVKFETTPKILKINLNDSSKRLLLPKSRPVEEKSVSVKDKLKATILKTNRECESVESSVKRSVKPAISDKKTLKKDMVVDKSDDKLKVSRNRAAAKRYRNKLKMWHHETKQRNIKLEEENSNLRAEVRQLKSLLLAHQDCSVAKAMASGKPIPVGLPKIIVKDQNSDNISIVNDVTMNPVFLIVNKPIEYNSTVSIS